TGLELVSLIEERNYQIESILLTGYDDFEYIQEAIRQNVCDYLLKNSSPDDIILAVERAKKRVEITKEYDQLKESEVEHYVSSQLRKLVENESENSDKEFLLEEIPLLRNPPFQLLLIDSDSEPTNIQNNEQLWNGYINGKWFRNHSYVLILVKRDAYLKDDYLLQIASRKMKKIYNKPMIMSEVVSSIDKLSNLYKQVTSLIPYQWIMPNRLLIDRQVVGNRKGIPYQERASIYEEELIDCLKQGDESVLKTWLVNFVEWLFNHPNATPESIQFYVEKLYITSIGYIDLLDNHKGIKNYKSIPPANVWFEKGSETLYSIFLELLKNFKSNYHTSTNYVEDSIIYMEKHLGESLSLQNVAEQIPIHPNYLSNMIRKKTGKSYMELLTELRIKKAVDYLLYTSINIKNIAELVGYNDSKYFTKIFKRYFIMTPTQYRDKYIIS